MNTKLYYIHDPMCSWCWGYRPVWDVLQQKLPTSVIIEYVVGGLAPDSDTPMPIAQQQMIAKHWHTIAGKLGTQFNYDFWTKNVPRRSTYNACRAAIAAEKQGRQKSMIDAIQRGYYLRAMNPSDLEVLISLAEELSQQQGTDFDKDKFTIDINSADIEKELVRQITLARQLTHQGFPSLVLEVNGIYQAISIDYHDYQSSLATIVELLN